MENQVILNFFPSAIFKLIAIQVFFVLSVIPSQVYAQNDLREQLVIPLNDPGKPGSLKVDLVNGSIKIIGYAGKEIIIDAIAPIKNDNDDDNKPSKLKANGMKKISNGSGLELSAEEKNNSVTVNSDSWKRPVNLIIKIPIKFSLNVSTVNDGDIEISNISGEIEVNNVNGKIEADDISGSIVANTVNGDIEVKFKEVTPNAPMAFTTLNGNVDISFPGNMKGSFKLKSENGEIFSDFDIALDKSSVKVDKTSKAGTYRVKMDSWVMGKINGGGAEILMKNMHGNLYIRKTK